VIETLQKVASRVPSLPGLGLLSPSANRKTRDRDLAGFLACQRLAQKGVREIAGLMREGWTERQAADLLNTWLSDNGVRGYFHKAFVWYGERTRYRGVKNYFDYLPTDRVLRAGEVFILDVAPIFDGYIADIGFTAALGDNPELEKAQKFLGDLRDWIPQLFSDRALRGGKMWELIDTAIKDAGYDNIHARYPFAVLGHRVHRVRLKAPEVAFINFGFQSYWEFLSRGLFGQLLNGNYSGDLTGLWAIEPHIGTAEFGAKFEEILVVDAAGARWLDPQPG
jgi:Xaa-Pro aminopeptidase